MGFGTAKDLRDRTFQLLGHVSKRWWRGTYFIQSLCDNIIEDDGNTKIVSIFAKVNGELCEIGKQVPVFEATIGNISFKDLAST